MLIDPHKEDRGINCVSMCVKGRKGGREGWRKRRGEETEEEEGGGGEGGKSEGEWDHFHTREPLELVSGLVSMSSCSRHHPS